MPTSVRDHALFREFPRLQLPWVSLGEYPTPIDELRIPPFSGQGLAGEGPPLFVKREDLSSPHYGGNKVRTLEAHIGRALVFGAKEIWATGAYGSNHAIASVTHTRRVGLRPGVMLWPQPPTATAQANMRATLAARPYIDPLASVATLPLGMTQLTARARVPVYLMSPGGATPDGALAHVSAALELAHQCRERAIPTPQSIVLAVGSTCTTAGLLAGLHLARARGIAFADRVPHVHAVRVTPWPVTSRLRVALYAAQTLAHLEKVAGVATRVSTRELHASLTIDRHQLGRGYGRPTKAGREAITTMTRLGGPTLDVVYSGKSAAAFFALARKRRGPLIFWATKSAAPLESAGKRTLGLAPKAWQRWLRMDPL